MLEISKNIHVQYNVVPQSQKVFVLWEGGQINFLPRFHEILHVYFFWQIKIMLKINDLIIN